MPMAKGRAARYLPTALTEDSLAIPITTPAPSPAAEEGSSCMRRQTFNIDLQGPHDRT